MPSASPPRNAPGCVGALLLLVAVAGGLWCAIFAVEDALLLASGLPGQDDRIVYLLVALLWGTVASVTTLVLALRRPAHTVRKMLAGLAAQALAVLWPLQLALLATYAATSRSLSRTVRVLTVLAAVALLSVGGQLCVRVHGTVDISVGGLLPPTAGSAGYESSRGPTSARSTSPARASVVEPGSRRRNSTHLS
ncbi:hypothetical protein [Streptomyces sp. NRRL F-5123]|uniref:hypothetical protein n=1 Tax=Streptomyces sp. NRRL F-5123 TaxID=1463856 RepID=UPI0004E0F35C|nr:hypothetical protein [Streptomyces sp. NRRL F-5123]